MAERARVFTIPAGARFLPTLADALLAGRLGSVPDFAADPLALADIRIFLPNHRAARALRFTATILVDCPDAAALAPGHPASAMLREAGPSAAFICFEGRCLPPVTDPNRLAEAVAAGR